LRTIDHTSLLAQFHCILFNPFATRPFAAKGLQTIAPY